METETYQVIVWLHNSKRLRYWVLYNETSKSFVMVTGLASNGKWPEDCRAWLTADEVGEVMKVAEQLCKAEEPECGIRSYMISPKSSNPELSKY